MFKYRLENNICVLTLTKSNLDQSFPEFVKEIEMIYEHGHFKKLLFSLKKLEMVDSKEIGLIIYAFNYFRGKDTILSLCDLNIQTTEVFSITGIERIMHIYPNEELALSEI